MDRSARTCPSARKTEDSQKRRRKTPEAKGSEAVNLGETIRVVSLGGYSMLCTALFAWVALHYLTKPPQHRWSNEL